MGFGPVAAGEQPELLLAADLDGGGGRLGVGAKEPGQRRPARPAAAGLESRIHRQRAAPRHRCRREDMQGGSQAPVGAAPRALGRGRTRAGGQPLEVLRAERIAVAALADRAVARHGREVGAHRRIEPAVAVPVHLAAAAGRQAVVQREEKGAARQPAHLGVRAAEARRLVEVARIEIARAGKRARGELELATAGESVRIGVVHQARVVRLAVAAARLGRAVVSAQAEVVTELVHERAHPVAVVLEIVRRPAGRLTGDRAVGQGEVKEMPSPLGQPVAALGRRPRVGRSTAAALGVLSVGAELAADRVETRRPRAAGVIDVEVQPQAGLPVRVLHVVEAGEDARGELRLLGARAAADAVLGRAACWYRPSSRCPPPRRDPCGEDRRPSGAGAGESARARRRGAPRRRSDRRRRSPAGWRRRCSRSRSASRSRSSRCRASPPGRRRARLRRCQRAPHH